MLSELLDLLLLLEYLLLQVQVVIVDPCVATHLIVSLLHRLDNLGAAWAACQTKLVHAATIRHAVAHRTVEIGAGSCPV